MSLSQNELLEMAREISRQNAAKVKTLEGQLAVIQAQRDRAIYIAEVAIKELQAMKDKS